MAHNSEDDTGILNFTVHCEGPVPGGASGLLMCSRRGYQGEHSKMLGSRRISNSPAANSAAGVAFFLGEACVSGVCSSFLLFWRPVDERQAPGGTSKAARLRTAPFASTAPNMGTSTNQKLLLYTSPRTAPEKVVHGDRVARFRAALQAWSIAALGMGRVSWPFLSLYIDGCV